MPHQRQLIREAAAAALTGATAAAARVYPTRVIPMRTLELPAIVVYTLTDEVADDSAQTAPRELTRSLALVIEAYVAKVEGVDIDDSMDAIALEIETAMHADPYLAETAGDSILAGTVLEAIEDGKRLMGYVELTYDVTYRTLAPEPTADANMDDFERVGADYNLGNEVEAGDQASDLFTVEEEP